MRKTDILGCPKVGYYVGRFGVSSALFDKKLPVTNRTFQYALCHNPCHLAKNFVKLFNYYRTKYLKIIGYYVCKFETLSKKKWQVGNPPQGEDPAAPVQEKWREISSFPNYQVSNRGSLVNLKTGRPLTPTVNQQGHLKVNLMKNGAAHTRQVNHLVALHFLSDPPRDDFISTIHLDGDKTNCVWTNLQWRPRYFAVRYHQQFQSPLWTRSKIPVVDLKTGKQYASAQQAAVENGLIFTELLVAANSRTFVWPTYQQFRTFLD